MVHTIGHRTSPLAPEALAKEAAHDTADTAAHSPAATPSPEPPSAPAGSPSALRSLPLPSGMERLMAMVGRLSPAATGPAARRGDSTGRTMVRVDLPGLGPTFLDAEMARRVQAFIATAHRHGVDLHFNSAYRSQAHQDGLRGQPEAIVPADRSLHSAGLAVDVQYTSLRDTPNGLTARQQRAVVRAAAAKAGLKWGGRFHRADPPHFYMEPAGKRQALIDAATRQVQALQPAKGLRPSS